MPGKRGGPSHKAPEPVPYAIVVDVVMSEALGLPLSKSQAFALSQIRIPSLEGFTDQLLDLLAMFTFYVTEVQTTDR